MFLNLQVLDHIYAVCRLESKSDIPSWIYSSDFYSISKTNDELSIVCQQNIVPNEIKSEKDWKCLKVLGPLDFSLTGILSSIAAPLALAKISIFAISTFDTDYLLVKQIKLANTIEVLQNHGFLIIKS